MIYFFYFAPELGVFSALKLFLVQRVLKYVEVYMCQI